MRSPLARRPFRTRPSLEPLEDRLAPAAFTVTNVDDDGVGSLRWAITRANAVAGPDVIAFAIPGAGVQTIAPLSTLPPVTDRVVIAGGSQPGFAGAPLIQITGGSAAGANGLVVEPGGSGSVIKKLVINDFDGDGVRIQADNCVVAGCFIGTDAAGAAPVPNDGAGVLVSAPDGGRATGNLVGGTTPAARNVVSSNATGGIRIEGEGATGNRVKGNVIGLAADTPASLGNGGGGVLIGGGASLNVVGGSTSGARNVISRNSVAGVLITGEGTTRNVVRGNWIGLDAGGTLDRGNSAGLVIGGGASGNVVGGPGAGRNVISGNDGPGIAIVDPTTRNNRVAGNFVGTDASGTAALGNASQGVGIGNGAADNVVGGTAPGARNVIAASGFDGVQINGAGTTGNRVVGNFIGTDRTGAVALGNGSDGVAILGLAAGNVVGGRAPGAGNVISGNGDHGVRLANATGNRVLGNRIGVAAASLDALGNGQDGVNAGLGSSGNQIGGTAAGQGNVIAHNALAGVAVADGTRNAIRRNRIFDNGGLGIDLGAAAGVTPNDLDDPDAGPNDLLNFPVLDLARRTAAGLRVKGSINTELNKTLRVEFFASPAPDGSGHGEGRRYLGFVLVQTLAGTSATFNTLLGVTGVSPGQVVTATATDEDGNTSEFSLALLVT